MTDAPQATPSPFRPGFNTPPVVLAGRDEIVVQVSRHVAAIRQEQPTPPPLLLIGARGVGKTVLLGELAARTDPETPWPRIHVEARQGADFGAMLIERLEREIQTLRGRRRRSRRRGFSVAGGELEAGLPVARGRVRIDRDQSSRGLFEIEDRLGEISELARARETGVILTLDELQEAQPEQVQELAAALQHGTPHGWPVLVAAAGLVSVRQPKRLTTYFERGRWHELGALDRAATHRALEEPAAAAGRPFDEQAAQLLAHASGGYPYAIQVYGDCAWIASEGQDQIDLKAAERGLRTGGLELDQSLYAQRWASAPPREREYLTALAQEINERGTATGADVARRLGRPTSAVSYARDRLLTAGTLVSDGHDLQFVVPGLAGYVTRATQLPAPGVPRQLPSPGHEK